MINNRILKGKYESNTWESSGKNWKWRNLVCNRRKWMDNEHHQNGKINWKICTPYKYRRNVYWKSDPYTHHTARANHESTYQAKGPILNARACIVKTFTCTCIVYCTCTCTVHYIHRAVHCTYAMALQRMAAIVNQCHRWGSAFGGCVLRKSNAVGNHLFLIYCYSNY